MIRKTNRVRTAFVDECLSAIEALKAVHGTYTAVAHLLEVSPSSISRARKEEVIYPAIYEGLHKLGLVGLPPPVDERPRRWFRTDDADLAQKAVSESYPGYYVFFVPRMLLSEEQVTEFLEDLTRAKEIWFGTGEERPGAFDGLLPHMRKEGLL